MRSIISKLVQSKIASGILLANLFAMTVIGLQTKFSHEDAGILIFSEFVIIPMLMGIISAWHWKNMNLKGKQITGYSIINGLIAIALSYLFLNEGVICLLIVSPLMFGFIISGAFIGRAMFKKNNQKLNTDQADWSTFADILKGAKIYE
ncbi:hypothetical protein OKW96_18500 [Sphingobacterium sp. KU25419]|nr:hypothetical protein OKW96_18500 [Sphingobacterium sp. KU25419]